MGNTIPEDEMEILKEALLELAEIPCVDSILVGSTFQEKIVDLEDYDYFTRYFHIFLDESKATQFDLAHIQYLLHFTKRDLDTRGHYFNNEYYFWTIEKFDRWSWKDLVTSYIIFDRNGIYSQLQDIINLCFKIPKPIIKCGTVCEIENIGELATALEYGTRKRI